MTDNILRFCFLRLFSLNAGAGSDCTKRVERAGLSLLAIAALTYVRTSSPVNPIDPDQLISNQLRRASRYIAPALSEKEVA